jgi:hypothetical protein
VPSGGHIRIPDNLKAVVLPDISLKSIEKGWAAHLKIADAVMSGRLSATTAIELQGAARHGDASFRAGHAHGLDTRNDSRYYSEVIRSFKDKRADAIFRGEFVKGLDGQIQQRAREKLKYLDAAAYW